MQRLSPGSWTISRLLLPRCSTKAYSARTLPSMTGFAVEAVTTKGDEHRPVRSGVQS